MAYKIKVDTVHDGIAYFRVIDDSGNVAGTVSVKYDEDGDVMLKSIQDRLVAFTAKTETKAARVDKVKKLFENMEVAECLKLTRTTSTP